MCICRNCRSWFSPTIWIPGLKRGSSDLVASTSSWWVILQALFIYVFETGSPVIQTDPKRVWWAMTWDSGSLLFLFPKCWDCRGVPPHPAFCLLLTEEHHSLSECSSWVALMVCSPLLFSGKSQESLWTLGTLVSLCVKWRFSEAAWSCSESAVNWRLGIFSAVLVSINGSLNTLFEQMRRSEGPSVCQGHLTREASLDSNSGLCILTKSRLSP